MTGGLFPEPPIAAGSPVGLGAAMAGGRSSRSMTERRGNDFYPTPPVVTRALVAREADAMRAAANGGPVWEPCGRGGAICGVLVEAGFQVVATDLGIRYCALLLKATFWHASTRTPLFRQLRPQRVYALNWRPDFLDGGAPTMEVVWCVWDRACQGLGTRYDVLEPARGAGLFDAPP